MSPQSATRATAEQFLAAWNTQDVEAVVGCYTEDLTYVDPNTRGAIRGRDAMRRYLKKLFANWKMTWTLREAHPLQGRKGAAVLWHAKLQRHDQGSTVEIDGMDFVEMRDGLVERNEVHFDRSALASLMGTEVM